GERDNRRNHQSARSPLMEVRQQFRDLALSKLAVEIVQAGLACHAERQVGADDRAGRGESGVVVPRFALPRREYGGENVQAAKGGDGGAVDDGENEQAKSA